MSVEVQFDPNPPAEAKQWMQMEVTHGFRDEQHVVPVHDEWTHSFAADCTCHPVVVGVPTVSGTAWLYTHNSWDAREWHDPTAELPDAGRME